MSRTCLGTPEWAAQRDGYECEGFRCVPYAPASIETRYAFAHFALRGSRAATALTALFWQANRDVPYHPIRVWQVWNEQNSRPVLRPRPDLQLYATLPKTTAAQIHGAHWGPT